MPEIDPTKLASEMDRAPMTQKQLVDALKEMQSGISKSLICDILAGRRNLSRSPHHRLAIARALHVPRWAIEVGSEEVAI